MMWIIIIIAIVAIALIKFFTAFEKDNNDLHQQSLSEKFEIIIQSINEVAFNGTGEIIVRDKRTIQLYQKGKNQTILFVYGTGHLTITWKYKYFQKEIVHEKQFNEVRNLSVFEQQAIAKIMIESMDKVVENHKRNVLGT